VIHNSPRAAWVSDAQLVTLRPDARHGPRLGQAEALTPLQPAQEEPGLKTTRLTEGRRPDLAVEPHERFVGGLCDDRAPMSNMTCQPGEGNPPPDSALEPTTANDGCCIRDMVPPRLSAQRWADTVWRAHCSISGGFVCVTG
jgi:hypothetical protein